MPKKQPYLERPCDMVKMPGANWRSDDAVSLHIARAGGRAWEMGRRVWHAGLATIAISLGTLPAYAQNAIEAPTPPAPVAAAPALVPANSREQIRRAQTELRRLDCLKSRINGKLDDHTREAVKKFWAMAKQPAVDVKITDELISNLAERGDNFCRPPRRFFGFGGRSLPPMFAPGARPGVGPRPSSPEMEPKPGPH